MVFSNADSWDGADFVDLEETPSEDITSNPEFMCFLAELEQSETVDFDMDYAIQQYIQLN